MRRPKPDALKIANYDTPEVRTVRPNDVLIKVRCDTLLCKRLIKYKLNVGGRARVKLGTTVEEKRVHLSREGERGREGIAFTFAAITLL
eukprot:787503-Amorphochlora_amoeboformis.AAC.3